MRTLAAPLAGALLLLAGCDRGTVDLDVADAPIDDAQAVVVRFDGVVLENANGDTETVDFDPPQSIDLAAQTEGRSARLLDGVAVPDGRYTALRLKISATGAGTDSWVDEASGARRALVLDEADAGRLRVPASVELDRGDRIGLTVDFDLRKSVLAPDTSSAPYGLRPSLRVVQTAQTGRVSGTVAAARAGASGCRPAVYLYAGHGVTPNDEGSVGAPFASALVRAAGSDFAYTVAFVPPGNYTAAFTCDAAADDPETDDATAFADSTELTVTEGQATTVDFP